MFKRTLIITPHCDDETIGCGGLMSSLAKDTNNYVRIVLVATHSQVYNYNVDRIVSNEERIQETVLALKELGFDKDNISLTQLSGFKDGRLDQVDRKSLVTQLDKEIRDFHPTAVLFPYSSHHQDHQAVYQASISALRPTVGTNFIKLRAAYEYPYITTSWNNNIQSVGKLYYVLDDEDIERKRKALNQYKTQLVRDPRDILDVSSIINLAKVRGTEIGHYWAEAFYPINIIMNEEEV